MIHRFAFFRIFGLLNILAALLVAGSCSSASALNLTQEGLAAGNLESWELRDDGIVEIRLRRDTNTRGEWRWYYFTIEDAKGEKLILEIPDADKASAAPAWKFNQPVASSDGGHTWRRIPDAQYQDGKFRFGIIPGSDSEQVALVYPYSFGRFLEKLENWEKNRRVAKVDVLAKTLQGRDLHHVVLRHPEAEGDLPVIWVTARQHPAETGASWKVEGLIDWLLSGDEDAEELLRQVEFHLAPFMNPDGVEVGNYRRNTAGINLNRVWGKADPETAPTVAAVEELVEKQVAEGRFLVAFYDLHSHSSFRRNFAFYNEDALMDEEHDEQVLGFLETYQAVNGDFTARGSSGNIPEAAGIAKNWAYLEFLRPAYTVESAYQDVDHGPYAGEYMTIERYVALGRDLAVALKKFYLDEGWLERTRAPELEPAGAGK